MLIQILCIRIEWGKTDHFIIWEYFTQGFAHLKIKELLQVHHQESINLSTIKRHLWNLSLCKRPIERMQTNYATLLPAAREKLLGSRCNIGYKRAWAHLRKRELIVHREDSLHYFTIRSRWSIKKKSTTGEVEKILQPRTKLCFAYRWPRQTKTV